MSSIQFKLFHTFDNFMWVSWYFSVQHVLDMLFPCYNCTCCTVLHINSRREESGLQGDVDCYDIMQTVYYLDFLGSSTLFTDSVFLAVNHKANYILTQKNIDQSSLKDLKHISYSFVAVNYDLKKKQTLLLLP